MLDAAIDYALKLGCELTIVHVYSIPAYNFSDGSYIPTAEMVDHVAAAAQRHLDAAVSGATGRGVVVKSVLRSGSPAEEICALADQLSAKLIVVGTHGRGVIRRAFLGSVAQEVVRAAKQPVLTIPLKGAEHHLQDG